jgi:CBS domain-containing protein
MKVKEIMSTNVIKASPDTKIKDAAKIMIYNNIRRLVVGDGIVTIRDLVYNWQNPDMPVKEISSKDLIFVNPEDDLKEACKIVTAKGIGSLLVGDGNNIQGIVTERDLIRYCKVNINGNVGDIMDISPIIASPDSTLAEIIEVMRQKFKRHAVIIKDNLPGGILSVRDIARPLASGRDMKNLQAKDFMTIEVYRVTPDSEIETARFLMAQKNIGFLPVVDSRSLLGSVSEREILAVLSI